MVSRMKILVSAYACSPMRDSEPGVGWGFVKALAEHHDLWVITEKIKFQDEIEAALQGDPLLASRVQFYFIQDNEKHPLRKNGSLSYSQYSKRWHWDAFQFAQQLNKEIGFDLVHQLTKVGFREPGYLWQLDIPFVWGPIGRMGYFPYRFLRVVGLKGAVDSVENNSINLLHSKFFQRPQKAAEKAGKGLITSTPDNQARALKNWGCNSKVIPEVGLPPCRVAKDISRRAIAKPLRAVWTGQHSPGNALGLALLGMWYIDRLIRCELHILGEGEETKKLKKYVQRHGLAERCHFHGLLSHKETLDFMQTCHVLLITSLEDSSSTVAIDGLAQGLPIICLDYGDFSHVVTSGCGIKIPVSSPTQAAEDISTGLTKMWAHEPWRQELAVGALLRAHSYSWEKKASQVNEIYQEVMSSQ